MLLKNVVAASILILSMLSLSATAAEETAASSAKKNPWVDCGIGAMIFSETKWAAAISNVIWDFGTTAVTSAISSDHTCSGKTVVAARFINENYANIEEETANGNGMHVTAMLNILGCAPSAQHALLESMRGDFGQFLKSASYENQTATLRAQGYYQILDNKISSQFSGQCQSI